MQGRPALPSPWTLTWLQMITNLPVGFSGNIGCRHQHGPWKYQGHQLTHGPHSYTCHRLRHGLRWLHMSLTSGWSPKGGHHQVMRQRCRQHKCTSLADFISFWAAAWTTDTTMSSGGIVDQSGPSGGFSPESELPHLKPPLLPRVRRS